MHAHAHAHAHAHVQHTQNPHTHTQPMHARTHTHTHAHAHSICTYVLAQLKNEYRTGQKFGGRKFWWRKCKKINLATIKFSKNIKIIVELPKIWQMKFGDLVKIYRTFILYSILPVIILYVYWNSYIVWGYHTGMLWP